MSVRTVTTTYASRAASSTVAPPTPMAKERLGGTDGGRRVEVRERHSDRAALRLAGVGQRERGLEQLLIGGADPQLAGHRIGHPGYDGDQVGRVHRGRDPVG